MILRILGSAAGGGLPQWNCVCPNCSRNRAGDPLVPSRLQSSLAVRTASGPWYLVNASPDIREQLNSLGEDRDVPTSPGSRRSPVAGVLLTDPEIDHTLGLMILRESPDPVPLYCSATVRWALSSGFPVLPALDGYCGVDWHELTPGRPLRLTDGEDDEGLEVEAFALPGDPPLYMKGRGGGRIGYQIGLTFRDPSSGAAATYAPGLAKLDDAVMERFEASDLILVDGTFWTNDEMARLGISGRTALDMGHLPLSGDGGSLERLSSLSRPRKILIHINNTNPILKEDSAERQAVEASGVEVASDGLTIRVRGGGP